MATGKVNSMALTNGTISVVAPHSISANNVFYNSILAFATANIRAESDIAAWTVFGSISPAPNTGFYISCASDNPSIGSKSIYIAADGGISTGANQILNGTYLRFSVMYFKAPQ